DVRRVPDGRVRPAPARARPHPRGGRPDAAQRPRRGGPDPAQVGPPARRGPGRARGPPLPSARLLQPAAEQVARARACLDTPLLARLVGLLGVATMLGLAVLMSSDRRRIDWRLVGMGLALQALFGVVVLKTAVGQAF